MPDAKRPTPTPPPIDPRTSVADDYLRAAHAKLAEQEAAKPRSRRRAADGRRRGIGLTFSVSPVVYLHIAQATIALTLAFLAITLTYHMLHIDVTLGRVVGLGTGFLVAAVMGYLSVCYLGVIESTSNGQASVNLQDADWKEWFWTLPASLGMLALSAAAGWLVSLVLPMNVWSLIGISIFITYPIFQLSSLETGSPAAPFSWPILRSIVRHKLAWIVMYGLSFALVSVVWTMLKLSWRQPPYATTLVMGPVITVSLFLYAWLLGQLAHFIISAEEK